MLTSHQLELIPKLTKILSLQVKKKIPKMMVKSGLEFISFERSIFQTFWKVHCWSKSLFFEVETSNFGSSYIFLSPLKWRGRIWPNLTFWMSKRHISGKCRYHYSKIFVSWDKCMKPEICRFWILNIKSGKIWPPYLYRLSKPWL